MPDESIRILITGSRTWTRMETIEAVLQRYHRTYEHVTMVSGHCPKGADWMCEQYAREFGWTIEKHPANWTKHGKSAGFIRNTEMTWKGADVCLAFIRANSRGATHCVRMAKIRKIPVRIRRQE
jgi:hypothetical protein